MRGNKGFRFRLSRRDLYLSSSIFNKLHMKYDDHFILGTRFVGDKSRQYLRGILLSKNRGNLSRYAKIVPECDNQSLHHFITNSPWDERAVIDHIQRDVSDLIGDPAEASIHIDESGFPKQGKHSVGVKRQYCGRLGKVENCQVGVFLGYVKGSYRTLIDGRLYLPRNWTNDKRLRHDTGVPEEVTFKTKAEIGFEMILNARQNGVPFGWVGMDCFYGEQTWLRNLLDSEGLIFVSDIPCDTKVWLSLPRTGIPERKSNHGRLPALKKLLDGEPAALEVSKIKDQLGPQQWNRVFVRDAERGELWVDIACLRVYPVEDGLPGKELWLIIRKGDQGKIKYQLSNAPQFTDLQQLAKMSCSRYWIERALEDAKGVAALADYEIRSWRGWNHHVAMSFLAMLVLLTIDIELGRKADLFTLQDAKEILEYMMPKRMIDQEELLELLWEKHKARHSAKMSYHRRSTMLAAEDS
jgi:SRSO17 transposase